MVDFVLKGDSGADGKQIIICNDIHTYGKDGKQIIRVLRMMQHPYNLHMPLQGIAAPF